MAASLDLLQITSVDLMHPQSIFLEIYLWFCSETVGVGGTDSLLAAVFRALSPKWIVKISMPPVINTRPIQAPIHLARRDRKLHRQNRFAICNLAGKSPSLHGSSKGLERIGILLSCPASATKAPAAVWQTVDIDCGSARCTRRLPPDLPRMSPIGL